jgi:hypothetical protein
VSPIEAPSAASSLIIRASSVRSRSIRWAWTGRFPIGYLVVKTGVEGLGKSVFDAHVTGALTRGELDGHLSGEPVNVLIVAGEDGIADTWRPRLELAEADLDRVAFLDFDALGPEWNLRDGIGQLDEAVTACEASVVLIDAALDHMPPPRAGESINSPTFVRQAFAPLRTLTRDRALVTQFSLHPPKAQSTNFRDLVQASQAFSAIPRVGLLFAYHPDDEEDDPDRRRVVLRGKGNLGRDPGALEFRIIGRSYTHDDGHVGEREVVTDVRSSRITMVDLAPNRMLGDREPSKVERAVEVLERVLPDEEWLLAETATAALASEGITSRSTITAARERAGVKTRKRPGVTSGPWEWRLSR